MWPLGVAEERRRLGHAAHALARRVDLTPRDLGPQKLFLLLVVQDVFTVVNPSRKYVVGPDNIPGARISRAQAARLGVRRRGPPPVSAARRAGLVAREHGRGGPWARGLRGCVHPPALRVGQRPPRAAQPLPVSRVPL